MLWSLVQNDASVPEVPPRLELELQQSSLATLACCVLSKHLGLLLTP
jgi:hypothetical protein